MPIGRVYITHRREARSPNGYCAEFRIEPSGFEPSHRASVLPWFMGITGTAELAAGGGGGGGGVTLRWTSIPSRGE